MNNNYNEKFTYFKGLQSKITLLHAAAKEGNAKLQAEFDQRKDEIEKEFRNKAIDLWKDCDAERDKYKAELKAWCGITDGETANILDLLNAVRKAVVTLDET